MFKFNRWYLLTTLIGSILIPLIPFEMLNTSFINKPMASIINVSQLNELIINYKSKKNVAEFDFLNFIELVYLIGFFVFLLRFIKEIYKIIQLIRKSNKTNYKETKIFTIDKRNEVFSFGKFLFIDILLFKKIENIQEIWIHESTHIKQNHTVDRLIIEVAKAAFWFVPFIYKYSECIKMNHEFLADDEVLKNTDNIIKYQSKLLDFIVSKHNLLVSAFNYKLTKKRLIMMKNKTKLPIQNITKIYVFLVVSAIFILFACTKKDEQIKENVSYGEISISETEIENTNNTEKPLTLFTDKASPNNGMKNFYQDFMRKYNLPENDFSKNDTLLKVVLNFIVEKDGTISNIKIMNDADKAFADEAIRILKTMPKWIPGKKDGEIVRSEFNLPIVIKLRQ